jgi:hypothetical protein
MKKVSKQKLFLDTTVIRQLDGKSLERVAGGTGVCNPSFEWFPSGACYAASAACTTGR